MTTLLFKFIVSYNGFRFNGFQRQASKPKEGSQQSNTADMYPTAHKQSVRPLKRPHYESKTGRPKGVPLTIQECIEQVLLEYTGLESLQDLQLRFAGRTDKGVHALGQVVTVHFPETIVPSCGKVQKKKKTTTAQQAVEPLSLKTSDIAVCEIQKAINSRLPVDISIEHVECLGSTTLDEDPPLLDPRRDAVKKQYSYTLKYLRKHPQQTEQEKLLLEGGINIFRNALDPPCMWHVPWALDDSMLPQLCQMLTGTHDYSVFVHKKDRDSQSQVMAVDSIDFEIENERTIHNNTSSQADKQEKASVTVVTARLVFSATGFRRSMVRNLVGFCVDRCRGSSDFASAVMSTSTSDTATALSSLWNDNQLWSFDNDEHRDQVALKIHAAPASGLCLDSVSYPNKEATTAKQALSS